MIDDLKAIGINVYIANGQGAGQNLPHVSVHIIPRFKDDKVQFAWENQEVKEKEMDKLAEKIRSKVKPKEEKKELENFILAEKVSHRKRIP